MDLTHGSVHLNINEVKTGRCGYKYSDSSSVLSQVGTEHVQSTLGLFLDETRRQIWRQRGSQSVLTLLPLMVWKTFSCCSFFKPAMGRASHVNHGLSYEVSSTAVQRFRFRSADKHVSKRTISSVPETADSLWACRRPHITVASANSNSVSLSFC